MIDESPFENSEHRPVKLEMVAPPTLQELYTPLPNWKNPKAAGPDTIPPEVFKNRGLSSRKKLHIMLLRVWDVDGHPERKTGLFIGLFDLTKAFNTVTRVALWRITERYG